MLDGLATARPDELMPTWPDGRIKMFLTQRVLRFRREDPDLFERGEYLSVQATGTFAECCVSFARRFENKRIVVIAPRLSSRIGFPPIGELWKDTAIELPETLSLEKAHDLLTCRPVCLQHRQLKIADALSVLPFAVITNVP